MAVITSHTLNGLDGTHAGGISVALRNAGNGNELFSAVMDEGGRLKQEVDPKLIDTDAIYELVFETEGYWEGQGVSKGRIIPQVVLRFRMTDADGDYHMPVILNPHSFSTWSSG